MKGQIYKAKFIFQCDSSHAMIEKKKRELRDMVTFEEYCAITAESSQFNDTVVMQSWDFRDWTSGKSDTKIRQVEITPIVGFRTVEFRKGKRVLYYNTDFSEPLKKLDFLSRYAYFI